MKMYLDHQETMAWVDTVTEWLGSRERDVDLFFFPQFPSIANVARKAAATPLGFGGQNIGPEVRGAFTGEVSILSLVQLGCNYVELGHWERRTLYNENDGDVGAKVRLVLEYGLTPVVCIGETSEEVESARRRSHKASQSDLSRPVRSSSKESDSRIRTPVGHRAGPTLDHIEAIHGQVRSAVAELAGEEAALAIRIIYGGSVDLQSAARILALPNVDGLFIGRAALNPNNFIEFVRIGESAR